MRFVVVLGFAALAACVGDSTVTVDGGSDATTDAQPPVDAGSDATDASAADVASDTGTDAATFDVKSLKGLVMWLNAGVGITKDANSHVTQWADQSGNGNSAAPGGQEPTLPTLVSATNNLPAVHFGGGGHLDVADATSLHVGTADFSLTIVMRYTTPADGNGGLVFAKQSTTNPYPGVALFAYLPQSGSVLGEVASQNGSWAWTTETTLDNDNPHIFGFHRVGASLATRLDGADDQAIVADAGTIDCTNTSPLHIGANINGGQVLTGDISEVVFIVGPTQPSDLAALEGYLKAKYKL